MTEFLAAFAKSHPVFHVSTAMKTLGSCNDIACKFELLGDNASACAAQTIPTTTPIVRNDQPTATAREFMTGGHIAILAILSFVFIFTELSGQALVGVVVGVVWAAQALALTPDNSNLRAMSLQDPKIFIAVLTWAVYSFAMFARKTLGWTGRRAAWLSALGFVIVLLNLLPVSYFVTTSHTFQ